MLRRLKWRTIIYTITLKRQHAWHVDMQIEQNCDSGCELCLGYILERQELVLLQYQRREDVANMLVEESSRR